MSILVILNRPLSKDILKYLGESLLVLVFLEMLRFPERLYRSYI